MITTSLRVVLVAAAAIAGSGVIAATSSVTSNAARTDIAAASAKAPNKAPKPYHLDGFHGWASGYPVVDDSCKPTMSRKLDTCGPGLRATLLRI